MGGGGGGANSGNNDDDKVYVKAQHIISIGIQSNEEEEEEGSIKHNIDMIYGGYTVVVMAAR